MGRPKLDVSTMTKKQIQRREINERYNMKKKMGTLLELNKGSLNQFEKTDNDNIQKEIKIDLNGKETILGIKEVKNQWEEIEKKILRPDTILNFTISAALTSYLIYQNTIFMSAVESNYISAVSSSIISELLPIACSASIVFTQNRAAKLFLSVVMVISIVGISTFFESGISSSNISNSNSYKAMIEEKDSILNEIKVLTSQFESTPDSYQTKKSSIANDIKLANKRLSLSNSNIVKAESGPSGKGGALYMIWIRICSVIVNCYIIHSLFSIFKKK